MASTSAVWSDLGTAPDLSGMAANDVKTVTGHYASIARLRALCRLNNGGDGKRSAAKTFSLVANSGPHSVVVTRTA